MISTSVEFIYVRSAPIFVGGGPKNFYSSLLVRFTPTIWQSLAEFHLLTSAKTGCGAECRIYGPKLVKFCNALGDPLCFKAIPRLSVSCFIPMMFAIKVAIKL